MILEQARSCASRLGKGIRSEERTVEEGGAQAFLGGNDAVQAHHALARKVRFYPDDALTAASGKVDTAPVWESHVVVDRELVTAQQPNSDAAFVAAFVPMVRRSRRTL